MLLALALTAWLSTQPALVESVAVHGNHTTPTADILALAGPLAGREATDALLAEVTARLDASGRFAAVDVRRRFLSIADPSRVLIVIVVDERAGVSEEDLTPGPLRRLAASSMWLPVVEYQEGYGFTYGARVGFIDVLGARTRVSAPLTWGGERQALVEVERTFEGGPLARVVGGGGITRRVNPAFETSDRRQSVWGRVESAPRPWLRLGAGARLADVTFGAFEDRLTTIRAEVAIDTRTEPALPRNAVFVQTAIERLGYEAPTQADPRGNEGRRAARRLLVDARGYVGVFRQVVLAVRAQSALASRALPAYELALLGGAASLRGWDVGSRSGDNLAAASAELLMPITTPLSLARLGVKVFVDTGATYPVGASLADQGLTWGYGTGVFLNATAFSLAMDVGWPAADAGRPVPSGLGGPNLHVQLGLRLTR